MTVIPIVALLGLLALAQKTTKGAAPDASRMQNNAHRRTKADVARLVQESKEIVQGKRTAYSDAPNKKVTPRDAASRVAQHVAEAKAQPSSSSSSDADAIRAAQAAAKATAQTPTPPPRPAPNFATTTPKKPATVQPVKKPTPQPTVVVQRAPAPTPARPAAQPPPGYDRVKAANAAPGLAKHLAQKGISGYSRPTLKAWQKVAGIPQDGIYGHGSHAALAYYAPQAPKAFFNQGTEHYPWGNA